MTHDPLPARDRSQGEPRTIGSLDGTVLLHIDIDAFDFYIQTKPQHNHRALCDMLTQADWWGLELLDEDECPAEMDDDGNVRIYLTPKVPVNNTEAFMAGPAKKIDMRSVYQRTLVGVLSVGLLLSASDLLSSMPGISA